MLSIIATAISVAVKVVNFVSGMGLSVKGLEILGSSFILIAKALGIITATEIEAVDLGDKALQAEKEGINPENYKTYLEYLNIIENFDLNPEKSKQWTESEKIEKGIELTSAGLVEKYGVYIEELLLDIAKNPEFFSSQRVKEYIDLSNTTTINYKEITDYLNGDIKKISHIDKINSAMLEIEKRINPNISDYEAQILINRQKK